MKNKSGQPIKKQTGSATNTPGNVWADQNDLSPFLQPKLFTNYAKNCLW